MDRILVIAEIGINHNGDIAIAKKLIDMAKRCGCDAVKFQKRTIDIVYSPETLALPRESPWGSTTRQQKEGLEFNRSEYKDIDHYCRELGMDWFASAWDLKSLEFLREFNLHHNKVASAMLSHRDFLKAVAEEGKHTFLSTGMSTLPDLDRAVEVFSHVKCPLTLMHTVSVYPCKDEELNLRVMDTLRNRYHLPVGYSGHEIGPVPSIIAAAMGAVAIERHITLDRAMYGSDQAASLEERGLEMLVKGVRCCEVVKGTEDKLFGEAERGVAKKLRYWEAH